MKQISNIGTAALWLIFLFSCSGGTNSGNKDTPSSSGPDVKKLTAEQIKEVITKYRSGLMAYDYSDCSEDATDMVYGWVKETENSLLDMAPVSEAEEEKMSAEIHKAVLGEFKLKKGDPRQAKLESMLRKFTKHASRKGIHYDIYILDDEMINAFSTAGGNIYFTTGILDFFESDDELAFVMGHEVSHVDLKHCVRKMQKLVAATQWLGGDLGTLIGNIALILSAPFGQIDEYESDKNGAFLTHKVGYNPKRGLEFFHKLEEKEGDYSLTGKLIRTHPYSSQRAACLEEYIATNLSK